MIKRLTIAFRDTRNNKTYYDVPDPQITPHFFAVATGQGVTKAFHLDTIDWVETEQDDRASVTE